MPRRKHDAIDSNRRRLVARLGLLGTLAYTAPALTAFGTARASGISGLSGPSRTSRPSAPSRPAPRQAPPPELVLLTPAGLSLGALEETGYRVISAASLQTLAGTLLRLGLPAGRSVAAARAELAALLPGAVADANHLYRPDEFLCDDDGCDAHEMIGWSGWTGSAVPRIGMIDTGINPDHDALRGQRLSVHQTDLSDRSAAGRQHGTAIAALLLGRADSRVPGLLPDAHLVAVEAFHSDAGG